jgi:hypothetical protein
MLCYVAAKMTDIDFTDWRKLPHEISLEETRKHL